MALLRSMTRAELTHVPYKGAGQANAAIVAGEVQLLVTALPAALPFIKSGRLRALGVTSPKRAALFSQVPAIGEVLPGYAVQNLFGMLTTARTPPAIINKLHREVQRITALPEVKNQFDAMGFEVEHLGPAEFTSLVKAEMAKWGKVFAERGIKPE
jgi:tripartite-type tricarboxylate transporter receptor subunit TctC